MDGASLDFTSFTGIFGLDTENSASLSTRKASFAGNPRDDPPARPPETRPAQDLWEAGELSGRAGALRGNKGGGGWADLGTGRAAPTRGGGERDPRSGARGPGPGGRGGSAGRDARRSVFSGSEDRVSPE
ncbi:hypothetical protein J1605_007128 [Eschrichtius robustus]|uniref:Uncharacterized protein n=1 Tax=Eschrichtius robustus TaxID=9764 RepID=A0AB34GYE8_ESCRO|nr:hypothetical protein J1605_007128 [Eschrichtius robustus]